MLRLSREARADLQLVYLQGLELFGSRQADDYIEGLFAKLDLLADFPRLGAGRPELSADAHVIFYKSHAILSRIDDADVFVRRIRHELEDWQSDASDVERRTDRTMTHPIHVGVGGWTFEPWRGVFYPEGLVQKRELEYAASKLTSIEINGTYYSTFKPDSWRKWRDETPADFVFSVKASRYCTNRKVLSEGGESFDKFLSQGLTELGDKLGPINWQFMGTKKFDAEDFEGFLKLLPKEKDGVRLRHALEVRNPTFATEQFYDLARQYGAAIVYAVDDEEPTWPQIDEATADFTYARLMSSREDEPTGMTATELDAVAEQAKAWAKRGEVFAYFISGAKVRNPAAAQALIGKLK